MLVSEAYITSEWNDQEWVRPMTAGHHRLPDTISSDILDTTNGVRVWRVNTEKMAKDTKDG